MFIKIYGTISNFLIWSALKPLFTNWGISTHKSLKLFYKVLKTEVESLSFFIDLSTIRNIISFNFLHKLHFCPMIVLLKECSINFVEINYKSKYMTKVAFSLALTKAKLDNTENYTIKIIWFLLMGKKLFFILNVYKLCTTISKFRKNPIHN